MTGRRQRIPSCFVVAICTLVGIFSACAVSAQSTMFLVPDSYQVTEGESFTLFLDREDNTQSEKETVKFRHTVWPLKFVDWFYIRAGGTQINKDSIEPVDKANLEYAVTINSTGSAMIGLDVEERIENINRNEFELFLKNKVAQTSLPEDNLPLPENRDVLVRRLESTKTLVTVGRELDSVEHSAVVLSKSGQTAEIRPIVDPASVRVGSELIFRIYIDAPSGSRLKVLVTHVSSGQISAILTDSARICHFKVIDSGVYFLEVHAAKPLRTSKEMNQQLTEKKSEGIKQVQPDWELVSASITFEINESKGESR